MFKGALQALFNNPDGSISGSKTWFTIASIVVLVKFALDGASYNGIKFGEFDAEGAAMILFVYLGGYVGRSYIKSKTTGGSEHGENGKADRV